MTKHAECHRRLEVMAALDDEVASRGASGGLDVQEHLASCADCREWVQQFEAMQRQLQDLPYVGGPQDLWPAVEPQLRPAQAAAPLIQRLRLLGVLVVGWRALQLFVDVPIPLLHVFIPLVLVIAVIRQLARDPLAIQTFAPELQKRGA